MAQRTITMSFDVFQQKSELPTDLQLVLEKAVAALDNAYIPYSKFHVGSAVLLANGQIISGSNQENASYPLCLCAERVVLAAAHAQYPKIPILAIAVTVKNPKQVIDTPASPCGACRQVICETENRYGQPMRVLMRGEKGEIFVFKSGKDLLPFSFNEHYLGEGY